MNLVNINLGWTNYVQLYTKRVPEFTDNVIILDGDVPQKTEYASKRDVVEAAENIIFLPLAIEKELFETLKDHAAFNQFSSNYSQTPAFNYDTQNKGRDSTAHWKAALVQKALNTADWKDCGYNCRCFYDQFWQRNGYDSCSKDWAAGD